MAFLVSMQHVYVVDLKGAKWETHHGVCFVDPRHLREFVDVSIGYGDTLVFIPHRPETDVCESIPLDGPDDEF